MNIRVFCGVVILGLAAAAAPSTACLAQSDKGAAAAKEAGTAAPDAATPNTNTNPHKHRYWRHRGGRHPHYGSRRVGT